MNGHRWLERRFSAEEDVWHCVACGMTASLESFAIKKCPIEYCEICDESLCQPSCPGIWSYLALLRPQA